MSVEQEVYMKNKKENRQQGIALVKLFITAAIVVMVLLVVVDTLVMPYMSRSMSREAGERYGQIIWTEENGRMEAPESVEREPAKEMADLKDFVDEVKAQKQAVPEPLPSYQDEEFYSYDKAGKKDPFSVLPEAEEKFTLEMEKGGKLSADEMLYNNNEEEESEPAMDMPAGGVPIIATGAYAGGEEGRKRESQADADGEEVISGEAPADDSRVAGSVAFRENDRMPASSVSKTSADGYLLFKKQIEEKKPLSQPVPKPAAKLKPKKPAPVSLGRIAEMPESAPELSRRMGTTHTSPIGNDKNMDITGKQDRAGERHRGKKKRYKKEYKKRNKKGKKQNRQKSAPAELGQAGREARRSRDDRGRAKKSPAAQFYKERDETKGLAFQEPAGYWANTYVPGDPLLRRLQARLAKRLPMPAAADGGIPKLDGAAQQYWQPFDPPQNAALALYLHADKRAVRGPARLLLQVGLKGTSRHSGRRPAMNIGIVLDLRGQQISRETGTLMRALISAFAKSRRIGDRFSLTVSGRPGGTIIPPGDFKHGAVTVAMAYLFGNASMPVKQATLNPVQAVEQAMRIVRQSDDPTAPLGSSLVVLITALPLGEYLPLLEPPAHTGATGGIPLSVMATGQSVRMDELDRLVLIGQGHRRLVERASEAAGIVDKELHAVSRAVARAVRLRIRLGPHVKLVEVLGSRRLDTRRAEQVREAEQSIDRRLSRNLGIQADRGKDEDGIQIVIPAYYAGDEHVILLDTVAYQPGAIADVTVRYKDLVYLNNGVTRANLSLGVREAARGPLERNVLKNFLALRLAQTARRASLHLAEQDVAQAVSLLSAYQELLQGLNRDMLDWSGDPELAQDTQMLDEYLGLLRAGAAREYGLRQYLADSLQYTSFLKVLPKPEQ
ncbi:MAG: pilus assembly protein PilP [Gammaproteobacteria bacterium]|nr:pilus assembly protein PilP [Gammaproteobacteria bacterium]